jgi:glutathione S-transferase
MEPMMTLTLFHAPMSRSSRIVRLIDEMGVHDQIEIRITDIQRRDGTGRRHPDNPHPEGKVPLLVHDGVEIWESPAIILYLTDLFPHSEMGRRIGHRQRGSYLSWLAWYGDVMEPVMVHAAAELSHPYLQATFRGIPEVTARLAKVLERQPWLLGESFSAADLLVHSPYAWFEHLTPDSAAIEDWIKRCKDRPSVARTRALDVGWMNSKAA